MPSITDRVRAFFENFTAKSAQTQAPYARTVGGFRVATRSQRSPAGARMLRNFADQSEAVRTAINWRKQQVSQSAWRVVRVDDPKRPPDVRVVKAVNQLFRYVNQKGESFRSLMDMVVEDLLVLDAGCIEIERTLGAPSKNTGCDIAGLYAVDGATIEPDPAWDGKDAKAIRYRQYLAGQVVAELRNDQLIFMMETPTTHRLLGLSRVETLVHTIESALFGEHYASDLLRQAAPPGMLHLGGGLSEQQVDAFRAYYINEIAGKGRMPIGGGGDGSPPAFVKFAWSPAEMLFGEYRQWLIGIIAFVFQIDKTIYGVVDDVNRSTSKTMSARTDQGFVALARLFQEYVTREIVSSIDPDHGFEFIDLDVIDPLVQAKIYQIYSLIGVMTPNEIRADGLGYDPVEWGDAPYNAAGSATPDPLSTDEPDPADPDAGDGGTDPADAPSTTPAAGDDKKDAVTIATTKANNARLLYLARPSISNAQAWADAQQDAEEVAKRGRPFDAAAAPGTVRPKPGYLSS